MLAKMIDKIVSLKETKIFEINGQTYADASLTRIPPHVDRPDCISVSGLDSICKLIRTELEKVSTTIMVQVKSNDTVEVMTTYLSDFSRNTLYRAKAVGMPCGICATAMDTRARNCSKKAVCFSGEHPPVFDWKAP
jgi:hypothetical protein